jgi:radical SAM protein with 4Fe4S-binding SPASM domain
MRGMCPPPTCFQISEALARRDFQQLTSEEKEEVFAALRREVRCVSCVRVRWCGGACGARWAMI